MFLWGMPGAGKSTFGQIYARHHDKSFADLDLYISEVTGTSPAEWIRTSGEIKFREVEAQLLRELWRIHKPDVIACGGGTPCFCNNATWMKRQGITLFLDVPVHILIDRLKAAPQEDRPLLILDETLPDRVQTVYSERMPFFKRAHIRLTTTRLDLMIAELDLLLAKWGK